MRAFIPLSLLLVLAACGDEPSFDERYNAQAGNLQSAANSIAADLDQQLNASLAAGRLGVDRAAPPAAPINRTTDP